MTRIDFYVLDSADDARRLTVVCKLAEKAAGTGERVFVHADEVSVLEALDASMWTFRANSFVAHGIVRESEIETLDSLDPVQLSCAAPASDRTLLINLAREVPLFFSRFERTLEVIDQSDTVRDAGRSRYRFYQDRGYPLKHHALS